MFAPRGFVGVGSSVPIWCGVTCLDDGAIIGVVDLKDMQSIGPDSGFAQGRLGALTCEHFGISWRKRFGARKQESGGERADLGDENFITWGTEVASRRGLVGSDRVKRLSIIAVA